MNSSAIAIDGHDVIHALWLDRSGRVSYAPFDTASSSWGSTIVLESTGWTDFSQGDEGVGIAADAAGAIHAAWNVKDPGGALHIRYANNASGGFGAAATVDQGTTKSAWHPTIAFSPAGDLLLAWIDGAGNYSADGAMRTRVRRASGAWDATVTIPDTAVAGLDNGPSLLIGADGTQHVTFCNALNQIRYWYNAGTGWKGDEQPPIQVTHDPVVGPDGAGGLYIYGHGTPDDGFRGVGSGKWRFHKPAGATTWEPWTQVVSGPIDDATSVRWSQFFHFFPDTTDFTYWTHDPNDSAKGYAVFLGTEIGGPPPSIAPLVGDGVIEPMLDTDPVGTAEAFVFTAQRTGTASTLRVWLDGATAATALSLGLYSDGAGAPGALLSAAAVTSPSAGWNTVTAPSVPITAGQTYWLALLATSGGAVAFRDRAAGMPSISSSQTGLAALPSMWSAGTTYTNAPASMFASP